MIVHCTTVHVRTDTRIRVKELASLSRGLGLTVHLFVQDGMGSECDELAGIQVVDIGGPQVNRMARMSVGVWRMYRAIRRVQPDVVHFHDPELIPMGLALRLSGIKAIYDVHENVPQQLLGKHWIPMILRRPAGWIVKFAEWLAGRMLAGIVAATPAIAARFPPGRTVTVQNYPIDRELTVPVSVPYHQRPPHFAYIGGISVVRGLLEMVDTMERIKCDSVRLQLAGGFQSKGLIATVQGRSGWSRVDFHGWATRPQVAEILGNVRAGLVLFHPLPNHIDAQPNKMFEYMAAGLPIIASNFAYWREIVGDIGCGLLVDPMDVDAVAKAMQWILDHPEEAREMGERGREAVKNRLNWALEAAKLLDLYRRLLPELET